MRSWSTLRWTNNGRRLHHPPDVESPSTRERRMATRSVRSP
jgi:hypothetical protein